jgi:hypothetical protein
MKFARKSEAGSTLVEVLVAILAMGIGLLSLLTLFPVGALNMAQAVQDDRAAAIAEDARALSDAGQALLSDTRQFVARSIAQGSVDPADVARLREEYEDLDRHAADIEGQLGELQSALPPNEIRRYVSPLLAEIRAIRQRIDLVILLLSLLE